MGFFEASFHVPLSTKKSFAHWTKTDLLVFSQKMAIYIGFWFIFEILHTYIDTADPDTFSAM